MIGPTEELFKRHRTEHPVQYELRPENTCFCIWKENCRSAALLGNREADQCLFLDTWLVQSIYSLNLNMYQSTVDVHVQPGLCQTWSETQKQILS